jgi:protein-S-isoprenylcysteine O-methyltransferase Ste14
MAAMALGLEVVFATLALGLRTIVQRRRTGDSGWRLGRPHSGAEATARAAMTLSAALLLVTAVESWGEERFDGRSVAGAAIAVGAVAVVSVAQVQMGASWRIGVDHDERTALVRSGLYRWSRNPISMGMDAFTVGIALMLRDPWSLAAAALMILGTEMQVRAVEEPYLRLAHGDAFDAWRRSTGRFIPHLGLIRPADGRPQPRSRRPSRSTLLRSTLSC